MKAKVLSAPHVVYHGDRLAVAGHKFSLHIHPRQDTCSQCEPGCCADTATPTADTATPSAAGLCTASVNIYTSMFTSLTRRGLDICPLPADVRDSCFRGGAGVRGGKCLRLSAATAVMVGGVFVCSGTAAAPCRPDCCGSGLGTWRWPRRYGDAVG